MGTSTWFDAGKAGEWIEAELAKRGMQLAGPLDAFYARPWSIVIRVPSSSGSLYFKAVSPELHHEIALSAALQQWHPECTLAVIASNPKRGWLLSPDGGTSLREVIRSSRDFRHWQAVLPVYARLQIDLGKRVDEMLALGEPDRRLATLPAQYERLLEDRGALCIDQPDGITTEQYARLLALKQQFAGMCAELADHAIPETLNHGDLTDGNVFVSSDRPVFFDWGDSAVSHPFFSLRTTFVSLYFSLGIDYGAPELDMLRDTYLEAWSEYGTPGQLQQAFRLAQKIAPISGALAWQGALSRLEGPEKAEYAAPVPSLLQEFLDS